MKRVQYRVVRAACQGCSHIALIVCFTLWFAPTSFAQSTLEQLRRNLEEGYYSSAAQVQGPAVIAEEPNNPEAYFLYSKALYFTNNIPAAREQLNRALSLSGEAVNPEYDHLNGLITAAEGRLGEAEYLLENAFLRSQDYKTAMDWGNVAWQAGHFEGALEAFTAASQTEEGKTQGWPHINRGRILQLVLGDLEGALEAYNTAITIFDANEPEGAPSPGIVESYYRLGEIYESLGNLDLARVNYEAARNQDPTYTPARNALERILRTPNP